jgi:SAM-dependent methyltransferase
MALLDNLKHRVMEVSRQKKLDQFYARYSGGPVLDAGVSGIDRIAGENIFLHTFRGVPELYTGLGVEDLIGLEKSHPGKRLITYDGSIFPFRDDEFEWVFSNAVIEHVGDDNAQLLFLNEMLRVGKNVFFTTPNRFFPVESHTNTLFLHWIPGEIFYRWCACTSPYWTKENLRLFSYRKLTALLRKSNAVEYRIIHNTLLGLTMTFSVICKSSR